jgi:hypothetical protein
MSEKIARMAGKLPQGFALLLVAVALLPGPRVALAPAAPRAARRAAAPKPDKLAPRPAPESAQVARSVS